MSAPLEMTVKTVSDQVCDRLRSELIADTHRIGEPLREEELAARFGVSRHPIRKALQKLTHEGLLVAKPNCGVVVAPSQSEHIEGLLTPMRVQLELYAVKRAFPLLTETHRDEWQAIVRQMQRAGEDQDGQAVIDQDAAFHQRLLVVAGLEEMIPVWQSIYGRMRDHHRQKNETDNGLLLSAYVHKRLLNSLFSGDHVQASKDWKSHLENGEFNDRARIAFRRLQTRIG